MKKIATDVLQFRGSHYDFGLKQGEMIRESILIRNRERQWKVRKPLFRIDVEETKDVYRNLAPFIWEELMGLQEALKWGMERTLLEFAGYRLNVTPSGCSIYAGENYLIRNYDYHPKTYDGRYMVYQPTDGGYATIGVSHKITGRSDGMNEKGLTMGYTFVNRKRPGIGILCYMIGRLVLELCANAEEAVDLLKEIPHRGSFSYVLYDKTSERPYIVEASPRRVEVRRDYSCTNHFKIQKEENRHCLEDSNKRLALMNDHSMQDLNESEAFQLLNTKDKGVFSDLYGSWAGTIHTAAYFPRELRAWFALGGDQEPKQFDFLKWLTGENFSVDQIVGQVNTEIPFLNMEKADWFKK
ncbi:C45 family autoproteolytic acyltransferase/hydrolase [Pullulanibacillus sp. KACC 23026]|uniref:C45 family autoproteolytic acyltransferase/hydolase n=1 Tax=Pullulanibacillus sp. KACC 23026 TaxID=3028315 RepID=UPI0023B1D404|nr:C45 family peptidase [Pullulanibacillus sp. KACC 23026]WEG14839.1 C45 family autoproteolytic acyltransferase/hydrolase [Pullulanibacillus sp. KACC 23026]